MWTKDALHDLIQNKLQDHRLIVVSNREPYQHRFAGGSHRMRAAGQRHGVGARSDSARLRRRLGGSRQRQRRSQDRSTRRTMCAFRPKIRATPCGASGSPRTRKTAITTAWPTRACGRLCHMVFTRPDLRSAALAGLSRRSTNLRRGRPRGGRRRAGLRLRSGLPFRPVAADAQGQQSQPDRRPVLAHSLAEPGSVPGLSLEGGTARRPAWATICSASTCAITARISWTPSIARSRPRSITNVSRSRGAAR